MRKTLYEQLVKHLEENEGFHSGAGLSRLEWPKYAHNERRGSHSPRSVIRRLEEAVEAKELTVDYRKGQAYYSATTYKPTPQQTYQTATHILLNGEWKEKQLV